MKYAVLEKEKEYFWSLTTTHAEERTQSSILAACVRADINFKIKCRLLSLKGKRAKSGGGAKMEHRIFSPFSSPVPPVHTKVIFKQSLTLDTLRAMGATEANIDLTDIYAYTVVLK